MLKRVQFFVSPKFAIIKLGFWAYCTLSLGRENDIVALARDVSGCCSGYDPEEKKNIKKVRIIRGMTYCSIGALIFRSF